MSDAVRVVIIGGGTAGWLSAAVIASHHNGGDDCDAGVRVLLVESSDIPTVGVGEGTWPTMKNTLRRIGLPESALFEHCHAAFKQGGKFVNWVHERGEHYYHPFTFPLGYGRLDIAPYIDDITHYADTANFQSHVCEAGLAPRTLAEESYQGQCNYAYHLDAGAFADLLKKYCKEALQVEHVVATVEEVALREDGGIEAVLLENRVAVKGDLFLDCSGFRSLLLGEKLGVPVQPVDDILFNDSALVMQVPYENDEQPLACHTIATAQNTGWIWDIGLTHRRGLGHVYAGDHLSDDEAEHNLTAYIKRTSGTAPPGGARKISFAAGYREQPWKHNCVAVGLAAGFVEPLEATAIMLVEISARYIAENLPTDARVMAITAGRFNEQMNYRWRRIIDFLKLHYTLTQRTEPYWRRHRAPDTIPESLQEDLALWRARGPVAADFDSAIELFPAASYRYVMYGMGFQPDFQRQAHLHRQREDAERIVANNRRLTEQLLGSLPPHRNYIRRWLQAARTDGQAWPT